MALKKRIIVNTSQDHNKFWMLIPDPAHANTYHVRNGRLGSNGQKQKPLDRWTAESKLRDKVRDGYHEVTEREFERLNTQAAIVGTTNKCDTIEWVERRGVDRKPEYHPVSDDYLADPAYDPHLLVHVSTRKEIGGTTDFWLLFTATESFELACVSTANTHLGATGKAYYMGVPVPIKGDIKKLSDKVEMAMGRLLGG